MLFQKLDLDFGDIPVDHLNLDMMGKVVTEEWIKENTSIDIPDVQFYRFHITPPNGRLNPHIDGTKENPRVWALNIPIVGKYNHTMTWYKYDPDNWHTDYVEPRKPLGNAKGGVPLDKSKLEILDQTIINKPTLLRTDIPHSLENYNNFHRIILSVRFRGQDEPNAYKDKAFLK